MTATKLHCKDKKTAEARKAVYEKGGEFKATVVAGKYFPPFYLVLESGKARK